MMRSSRALVLLDLCLPDGNGVERIASLRALHPDVGLANLIAHVSSLCVSSAHTDADAALAAPLRAIGTFAGTDRSLLFQVDPIEVWMGGDP